MEKYELNWLGKEFAKKQIESPVQTILVEKVATHSRDFSHELVAII